MQGFGAYEQFKGRTCYRPPSPPFPRLDDIWETLDPANRAIDAFARALAAFPVPGVVGKLFARLDAVHSSGAEGSTTTFTDLLEYQTALRRARDIDDARDVFATAVAFDDLAESGAKSASGTVLDIHHRLFIKAVDPILREGAGKWKGLPNGTHDDEAPSGIFYYCSPDTVKAAMTEWEALTLAVDSRPELVRQALSHWMFEHIHPVPDGNGRIGRLMVPIMMRQKGVVEHACAFLGEAVHINKNIYIEALKRGRLLGDLTGWTRVFCAMAKQTAEANLSRLEKLGSLHARWLAVTSGVRSHSAVHPLVPWVLTKPKFTVRDALVALGGKVSFQAMNTAILRLKDFGIVEQDNVAGRERLFSAAEVIKLFEPVTTPQ